ncbi:MAG: sialidase family protein [bacterium]
MSGNMRLAVFLITMTASAASAVPPVQLDSLGGDCAPITAAPQGTAITAAWGRSDSGATTLIARQGPAAWLSPITISSSALSWYYAMCSSPVGLYMVISNPTPNGWHLCFTKSTDGGVAWSSPVAMPLGVGNELLPKITYLDGAICLVWVNQNGTNYECAFTKSTDDGVNWSAPIRLSGFGAYVENVGITSIAPGTVCVVWTELTGGANKVCFRKSINVAGTWNTALRVSMLDNVDDTNPVIAAASGGKLVVAYQEFTGTVWEVMAQTSADGGAAWGPPVILSPVDQKDSRLPAIAADPMNKIGISWTDDSTSPSVIGWRASTDGGNSWQDTKLISAGYGSATFPQMLPATMGGWELFWVEQALSTWHPFYARVGADPAEVSPFEIY